MMPDIKCAVCDDDLKISIDRWGDLKIEPCKSCLEEAHDKGYEEAELEVKESGEK